MDKTFKHVTGESPVKAPRNAKDKVRFRREKSKGGLEILRASFHTYCFAPHTHDKLAVAVNEKGACSFKLKNTRHLAPEKSVVLINPGEVHTGCPASELGWHYRMIYVHPSLLERAARGADEKHPGQVHFPHPVIQDQRLARFLVKVHTVLEKSPILLERDSLLVWALTILAARHAEKKPNLSPGHTAPRAAPRAVNLAREILEANFTENISLKDLSAVADLSPYHLLRQFKRSFGLPPHAYLIQKRISLARDLMAQGMPIAQAAAETGFIDQSHLTRHFKRTLGITPGQYLR